MTKSNKLRMSIEVRQCHSVMDVSGWYLIGAMEVMQAELSICSLAAQLSSFRKIIEIVAQRFTLYGS
jgi:hypothetical protein